MNSKKSSYSADRKKRSRKQSEYRSHKKLHYDNNYQTSSIQNLIEEGLRIQREKAAKEEIFTVVDSDDAQISLMSDVPIVCEAKYQPSKASTLTLYNHRCAGLDYALRFFPAPQQPDWNWRSYARIILPFTRQDALTNILSYPIFDEHYLWGISAYPKSGFVLRKMDAPESSSSNTTYITEKGERFKLNPDIRDVCQLPNFSGDDGTNSLALLSVPRSNQMHCRNRPVEILLARIQPTLSHAEHDMEIDRSFKYQICTRSSHCRLSRLYYNNSASSPSQSHLLLYGETDVELIPTSALSQQLSPLTLFKILSGSNLAVRTVAVCPSNNPVYFVGLRNGSVIRLDSREPTLLCKSREDPPAQAVVGRMDFCIDHIRALQASPGLLVRDITGHICLWDIRRSSASSKRSHVVNHIVTGDPRTIQRSQFFVSPEEKVMLATDNQFHVDTSISLYDLRNAWNSSPTASKTCLARIPVNSASSTTMSPNNWVLAFADMEMMQNDNHRTEDAKCYMLMTSREREHRTGYLYYHHVLSLGGL